MQTIPELLVSRAQDSGKRAFCTFGERRMTFQELLAGVQEMAGALAAAGVQPGDRIGYMLNTSLEHVQLYLAASWLGAVAVPFSIHLKTAGVELQLSSSKPRALVVNRAHAKVAEALDRVGLRGMGRENPVNSLAGSGSGWGLHAVLIARCIVYSPSIIMMGEPLGALDKNLREQMQGHRRSARAGITDVNTLPCPAHRVPPGESNPSRPP